MKIKDVMTENPVMIDAGASICEAAKKMRDEDCGVLPILRGDEPVGVVTDRDITIWAVAEARDVRSEKVTEIMTEEIIYCKEEDDLEKAADVMSMNGVRRLVVQDRENRVVGVVSIADLMKNIGDERITDEVMHHVLKYA